MTRILLVDDAPAMVEQYAYDLERIGGYETLVASGGREALDTIEGEAVDCVILDLEMPGLDGFDVLRSLKERSIEIPVIVYTGTGNYDRCVQAIRLGAYGFIDKAEPMERVVQEIENALERSRLVTEVRALKQHLDDDSPLIGSSAAMRTLKETIAKIAPVPSTVLILGESGSGKELVARELHRLGPQAARDSGARRSRAAEPHFVAINCAALPEHLVESELFGHERGAFTGAARLRRGAFEAAGRGTLLLDEVGELQPPVQAKLLRTLEQHEVTRVGGEKPIAVNARVVAATNRDLEQEVAAGRFRQDLFYRLNVHVIRVPPLRERLSDVPELVAHIARGICRRYGIRTKQIDSEVFDVLMSYDWKRNNVRELRNVVERMIISSGDNSIRLGNVPPGIGDLHSTTSQPQTFQELKAESERRIVVAALERNGWQITKTAQQLGLADHASLLKIMRKHGLRRPELS
ncbi:MAG: sigma-54-dependent transcriptional regulator [Gemmatimonadales bacterium]